MGWMPPLFAGATPDMAVPRLRLPYNALKSGSLRFFEGVVVWVFDPPFEKLCLLADPGDSTPPLRFNRNFSTKKRPSPQKWT